MSKMLFAIGQCCITPGAQGALASIGVAPITLIRRHQSGDWGCMDKHDQVANVEALKFGFRVFSVFELAQSVRVWIITEADRSSTTILLPEEY